MEKSFDKHPAYQPEDLEVTNESDLKEAKEMAGVTSHELAMKRWADKNPDSKEALRFMEVVKIADELNLSEATRERFINGNIHYDAGYNYVRPLDGVTEDQIIEFIEKVPVLERYCACGSRLMSDQLLEALIKKNPRIDLTDIYVIPQGNSWIKKAKELSGGQCKFAG